MKKLAQRHRTIEEDAKAGDGRDGSIVARYCRATRRVGTRAGRRALSVRGPTTGFVDVVQV